MALRSFLFSSDEEAAGLIREVLAGLGIEGESCPDAMEAAERLGSQAFQIVIIDWDQQPDAASLLRISRERKANERPLALAIVSDDASVPKALQAGANSVLRKPIMASQATDTLTTARDLLRAKQDSAKVAVPAPLPAPATLPASMGEEKKNLRAGQFLQNSTLAPGGQFETETETAELPSEQVDPLQDLEPMAAAVARKATPPTPAPPVPTPVPPSVPPVSVSPVSVLPASDDEPRGLEWYLKNRAGVLPPAPGQAAAPAPAPSNKPELLGFDQTPSFSPSPVQAPAPSADASQAAEQKRADTLFSYIEGEEEPQKESKPRFRLGKGPIIGALVLAGCAVALAPQAPWHPQMQKLFRRGQVALHAWLNPQPVTTAQAPESHENFGRPGDEYKLPTAETIPDATTDPSQIQVLPVVDPTAKKPTTATTPDPTVTPADGTTAPPADGAQQPSTQVQDNPQAQTPGQTTPAQQQPAQTPMQVPQTPPNNVSVPDGNAQPAGSSPQSSVVPDAPRPAVATSNPPPLQAQPAPVKHVPPQYVAAPEHVPSSLKSQMASMVPDASGNKAPETAMQAIEPVAVPEATERDLAVDQPMIGYPAGAKGQQGNVILQVLIGRDGTVQDAKFQQGSLAFARAAIDGVKQWKFKPYVMNGRPVSVQTTLTMSFKP